MIKSLVIFVAITVADLVSATNYCSGDLCFGSTHIACDNNGAYGSKCPSDRMMVLMSSTLKNLILDSHNTKRNTLASGKLSNFKPAVRMATMHWDDELASLAALNVKSCEYENDQCRNTYQFKFVGQNLARNWWTGPGNLDSTTILTHIDSWWMQYKNASTEHMNSYSASSSKPIGSFAVMSADKNIAVGCGAIKYRDSGKQNRNSLILVCNYATNNMLGRRVYEAGPTASKCTSGKNPNYSALCSLLEQYDVNTL